MSGTIEILDEMRHTCLSCGGSCQGNWVRPIGDEEDRIRALAPSLGVTDPVVDGKLRMADGKCVFLDADKDGVFDAGEKSALTSSTGAYKITGLAAGSYRVREVLKSGWRRTTPSAGYHTVTLTAGEPGGELDARGGGEVHAARSVHDGDAHLGPLARVGHPHLTVLPTRVEGDQGAGGVVALGLGGAGRGDEHRPLAHPQGKGGEVVVLAAPAPAVGHLPGQRDHPVAEGRQPDGRRRPERHREREGLAGVGVLGLPAGERVAEELHRAAHAPERTSPRRSRPEPEDQPASGPFLRGRRSHRQERQLPRGNRGHPRSEVDPRRVGAQSRDQRERVPAAADLREERRFVARLLRGLDESERPGFPDALGVYPKPYDVDTVIELIGYAADLRRHRPPRRPPRRFHMADWLKDGSGDGGPAAGP